MARLLKHVPARTREALAPDEPNRTALAVARAARTLAGAQTTAWLAQEGDAVHGLAAYSTLAWDTEQLSLAAARLDYLAARGDYAEQYEIKQALLQTVLIDAAAKGVQHLSARVDASDLAGLHALERAGFVTLDGLLTFALELERGDDPLPESGTGVDLEALSRNAGGVQLRLATPGDADAAAELARHAFIYDRFHSDPAIAPERADHLHAVWLYNACARQAADAVVLAEDDGGLEGLVTCQLQRDTPGYLRKLIGTIVLVATAERARGQGIARLATQGALAWFRQQGCATVQVGTQLRNIPASRLYEGLGFRLVSSGVSLRKLI